MTAPQESRGGGQKAEVIPTADSERSKGISMPQEAMGADENSGVAPALPHFQVDEIVVVQNVVKNAKDWNDKEAKVLDHSLITGKHKLEVRKGEETVKNWYAVKNIGKEKGTNVVGSVVPAVGTSSKRETAADIEEKQAAKKAKIAQQQALADSWFGDTSKM